MTRNPGDGYRELSTIRPARHWREPAITAACALAVVAFAVWAVWGWVGRV